MNLHKRMSFTHNPGVKLNFSLYQKFTKAYLGLLEINIVPVNTIFLLFFKFLLIHFFMYSES